MGIIILAVDLLTLVGYTARYCRCKVVVELSIEVGCMCCHLCPRQVVPVLVVLRGCCHSQFTFLLTVSLQSCAAYAQGQEPAWEGCLSKAGI